jgi:Ni,Fe-hydrogenase III small subunit/ferredoxin
MPWIPRGLRNGIVTSRYPYKPDGYGAGFRGTIEVNPDRAAQVTEDVMIVCPTRAITVEGEKIRLDQGKCILCGRCVTKAPQVFRFAESFATSDLRRRSLVVPSLEESDATVDAVRDSLARRVKTLRRSIHVRHVDAGSDGSDEWEVAALTNPVYDVQRLGIYFTASPRHADVLLVTGAGSTGMTESLLHTFEVMPYPKVVLAAGVEAISGGLIMNSYVTREGIASVLDVDVFVPGSPASPFGLLHGLLMAVNLLPRPMQHVNAIAEPETTTTWGREVT